MKWRRRAPRSLESILNPSPNDLRHMSPDELAEYKAGWKEGTKNWILADREQHRQEAWSWPVRLSLLMSAAALAISLLRA